MKTHSSYLKWVIWSLAAIFYLYEFILRISPGVMVTELMHSFGITASTVGILSSIYLYAYAPMQLPVGMIMDRYGIKKILSLASLTCGIGAIVFALTHNLFVAGVGRFLIGAGSSFAFVAMVYVTSYWFDARKRAFLVGIANSLAMLGASIGVGPLSMVVKVLGWQLTILLFGFFGIILGLVVYYVLKSDKKDEKIEEKTERIETNLFHSLKTIVSKKVNWINAFVALLFYITTTAFGGLWGTSFIQASYGVSKEIASYSVSMIFIGWLAGGPLMGLWSDYIGRRTSIIRIGIIGTLICLIGVIYFPFIHIYLVYILLFFVGFFSSAELLNFSMSIELNTFKSRATAAAFTNCIISFGDAIIQPLIGFILDLNWAGSMSDQIRVYSIKDYQIAMSTLPIGLIFAFGLLFFIKEKRCID